MIIFGLAALALSALAFFIPILHSVLLLLSGLITTLSHGKGLIPASIAISLNIGQALFLPQPDQLNDWLFSLIPIDWQTFFILLLFSQILCLGTIIWKWALHEPPLPVSE